jgi:ATP-dependent DNA helicase RecG
MALATPNCRLPNKKNSRRYLKKAGLFGVRLFYWAHKDQNGITLGGGRADAAATGTVASCSETFNVLQSSIDLDHLARRESEQTEWKENVADPNDVVRCLVAFANDLSNLGGGYVVCGVAEGKDHYGFPQFDKTGLTATQVKSIEGTVLSRCRDRVSPALSPRVEEHPANTSDRRILVFIQPATGHAHTFREGESGGKYYVRVSRDTVEARNGLLRDLLVRKGEADPWDRRPCSSATTADIDLLALRNTLSRMGHSATDLDVTAYLSDSLQIGPFVPPLCAREALTGVLRPRNFALLLFSRNPSRFIPGAVSIFSIYAGTDRSEATSERREVAGSILEQSDVLGRLLDMQATETIDKSNLKQPNIQKYPSRALYEALGNALAHRDYQLDDPTRITVFSDRIEFYSPGSLPQGLDFESYKSGKLGAKWRNQALAWFFNRLQLAQAEGQGIPTILRIMSDSGAPPPIFSANTVMVGCILPAHPFSHRNNEVDAAQIAFEAAQRRLNLAKAEQLFLQDPCSRVAWELFLKTQPTAEPVWHKLRDIPDFYVKLPRRLLLEIANVFTRDSDPLFFRPLGYRIQNFVLE